MGDIADAIINGDMDEETGEWLGGGQGFPRTRNKPVSQKSNNNILIPMLGSLQKTLIEHGYIITKINPIDTHGFYLKTASGSIINIYTNGKMNLQGTPDAILSQLIIKS